MMRSITVDLSPELSAMVDDEVAASDGQRTPEEVLRGALAYFHWKTRHQEPDSIEARLKQAGEVWRHERFEDEREELD